MNFGDDSKSCLRFLVCLILFISTATFAGMTVEDYKTEPDNNFLNAYIAGLLNGFAFANTELQGQKRIPLYCAPADLVITVDFGRSKLEKGFKRYSKLSLPILEIEPVLLRELIEAYPCKK